MSDEEITELDDALDELAAIGTNLSEEQIEHLEKAEAILRRLSDKASQ
jgi:hypothetical protein